MSRTQTLFERITPSVSAIPVGFWRFCLDILRAGATSTAPILIYLAGEKLACIANGNYADEVLGSVLLVDVCLTAFILLPAFTRAFKRLFTWVLFAEGWFSDYQ